MFCIGVSKAVPYATSNISGQCASPYWGARAQHILDQMSKFTPPQYVPNHILINNNGLSRSFSSTVASLLCGPPAGLTDTEANASAAAVELRNYDRTIDDVELLALCKTNDDGLAMVPKSKDVAALSMELDPSLRVAAVKSAIRRLKAEGFLVNPK